MNITIQTADGSKHNAYLALPAAKTGPGILVLHAWWGLTPFFETLCAELAAAGFVALAPDLYGGPTAETIAEAEALAETLDDDATAELVKAAVDALARHPAVNGRSLGTIGFSLGAPWSLLAATALRPEAVRAVVLFYGNHPGLDADDYARSHAAFLGHFAAADPYEDEAAVERTFEQMRQAGRTAVHYVYPNTGHWFFESNQPAAYEPEAADLAWERTITFLRAHLA
ncbi:MAG: dienelactone hydrolase family protein [Anaerolineales bacterium]|nr:dienelactone hydrolase family protein [Anaerolineales bacterium]